MKMRADTRVIRIRMAPIQKYQRQLKSWSAIPETRMPAEKPIGAQPP